ncbi:hypothetical protein D3C81_11100 [compost metagenome]
MRYSIGEEVVLANTYNLTGDLKKMAQLMLGNRGILLNTLKVNGKVGYAVAFNLKYANKPLYVTKSNLTDIEVIKLSNLVNLYAFGNRIDTSEYMSLLTDVSQSQIYSILLYRGVISGFRFKRKNYLFDIGVAKNVLFDKDKLSGVRIENLYQHNGILCTDEDISEEILIMDYTRIVPLQELIVNRYKKGV